MAGSILSADMTTVGRWLRSGWDLWLSELAGLVPARFRRGAALGRGVVAAMAPGGAMTLLVNGAPAQPKPGALALVALDPALALVRSVPLPALADADLRRLVTLQLDRLLPFPAGEALVDVELAPGPDPASRIAAVAAIPMAQGTAIAAAVAAAHLTPRGIGVAEPDGRLRFDFLPALNAAIGLPDPRRGRRFWWRVVAVLFLLNLLTLVAVDVIALRHEEALVAQHADAADAVRLARRRVMAEDMQRQLLGQRHDARDPLALLADLTRRLPGDVWLRRLTLDEDAVRLEGYRRSDLDLLQLLRRGGYRDVHASSADALAAGPQGQPFDISFTLPPTP